MVWSNHGDYIVEKEIVRWNESKYQIHMFLTYHSLSAHSSPHSLMMIINVVINVQ